MIAVAKKSEADREAVITSAYSVVGKVCRYLSGKYPFFSVGDLTGPASEGLIDAWDRWRPELGPFRSYAWHRVRGAALDHIKAQARKSRGLIRLSDLNVDNAEYSDDVIASEHPRPIARASWCPVESGDHIDHLFSVLTRQEERYARLYFIEGLFGCEIARFEGKTESRVCQVLGRVRDKISRAVTAKKRVEALASR